MVSCYNQIKKPGEQAIIMDDLSFVVQSIVIITVISTSDSYVYKRIPCIFCTWNIANELAGVTAILYLISVAVNGLKLYTAEEGFPIAISSLRSSFTGAKFRLRLKVREETEI